VESLVRNPSDDAVERPRLYPVEPAVQPGRPAGHHHVRPVGDGIQQKAQSLRLHLEVRGKGDQQIAPALLYAEPECCGLAERPRKAQKP
jgi:hypothetical protein